MELEMTFHSVGNFIMPTDKVHHFSEGLAKNHQPAMDFLRFLQRNLLWALQIGLDRLEPHSVSPMARKASCHTTAGSYACRCWQNSSRNITKSWETHGILGGQRWVTVVTAPHHQSHVSHPEVLTNELLIWIGPKAWGSQWTTETVAKNSL